MEHSVHVCVCVCVCSSYEGLDFVLETMFPSVPRMFNSVYGSVTSCQRTSHKLFSLIFDLLQSNLYSFI